MSAQNPIQVLDIPLAQGSLRVYDQGPRDAPCVMFAHSIMANSAMWEEQAALLAPALRVIRYDSRGHGQSAAIPGPYTMPELARDAIAILDALGIGKAHFVGLSLGGIIGFDLALHHRERLHSLVVCDARADCPPEFAGPWDERIDNARQHGMETLVDPTMARWFGADFLQGGQADAVRAMIRETSVEGFSGTARGLQSYDYSALNDMHGTPCTLIVGERDGVLPKVMEQLAGAIRGADFVTIANAGHLPNLENPQGFNQALLAHLRAQGLGV